MPNNGYFDIKRDNQLIAAGTHVWCQACLVARPLDDQSPDPRYCQGCHDSLLKEAELLPPGKRPAWIPKIEHKKPIPVSQDAVLNMATVEDGKSKVAIIPPPDATRTLPKRGPKHKVLPVELITQWASEGMGYKRIAARLKAEHGIEVGFRTIARVVKGERKQLQLAFTASFADRGLNA